MKLLVTGGAGFIGSHFIVHWMDKHPEDSIVNLDKLTYAGNLENLKTVSQNPNYFFIKGDITHEDIVQHAMQNIDIVVNFAAETHVDRSIADPKPFVKTNVYGTYVLLEAARLYKVKRFHHISTDEVFGSIPLDSSSQFSENTEYNPSTPYSASKAGSDHLVRAYFKTYGLPISISNSSNNYGPFMYPEKLIPLAITNALEDKKIPLHGDGLHVRDWLHVSDHVRAIDCIITRGAPGETYLIGGLDKGMSNIEVLKVILAHMKKPESLIEHVKDRQGNDRKYNVNWDKIKNELNWQPRHSFDEWIIRTINWYTDNRQWWEKIKQGEFNEYYTKTFKDLST